MSKLLYAGAASKMVCGCGRSGCTNDTLYLKGRCHPFDPTLVLVENDVLKVSCKTCKAEIANVAVEAVEEPLLFSHVIAEYDQGVIKVINFDQPARVIRSFQMRNF